ncbi:metalloregulator ArsR/SmtB family transcription factor [Candidatus Woesearchaeota archaeon]|nr:metalloregulator ArsR/SmtB family transcription factor [Candidatus Woesearchaeota archaeon]
MKCNSYNLFFETISSPLRIRILEALLKKPMCVNEICEELGEEQSKISHNLKKLSDCHFINAEQAGKKRVYSLNADTIVPLMRLVEQHVSKFCTGECMKNSKLKNQKGENNG